LQDQELVPPQPRTPTFEQTLKLGERVSKSSEHLRASSIALSQLPQSGYIDPNSKAWLDVVDGRWSEQGILHSDAADALSEAEEGLLRLAAQVASHQEKLNVDNDMLKRAEERADAAAENLAQANELQRVSFISAASSLACYKSLLAESRGHESAKEAALQKWLQSERSRLEAKVEAERLQPTRPFACAAQPSSPRAFAV